MQAQQGHYTSGGNDEWHNVLADVKQQALTPSGSKDTGSAWFDLAEDASTPSPDNKASALWQQHRWAEAFSVLVSCMTNAQTSRFTAARSRGLCVLQFFQAPASSASQEQDDLLFFVYLDAYQKEQPYTVRRKGKALPAELVSGGSICHQIDWKSSVMLNLVTQTSYSMTVAACPREQLQAIGSHAPPTPGIVEVRKAVYASTTKSQLNLTNRKIDEANPSLTYPDMSFAVDNFEEAFESLLLTQPEHCYLVLLTASGGMTLQNDQPLLPDEATSQSTVSGSVQPPVQQQAAADATGTPSQHPLSSSPQAAQAQQPAHQPDSHAQAAAEPQQLLTKGSRHKEKILFSGFVSYEQLQQKLLGPQKGPWWLQKPMEGSHPVRMRGPGGIGCADVAVTCLARAPPDSGQHAASLDQGHAPMSPSLTWEELRGGASPSPSPPAKQRTGLLGSALGAAAQVVKRVANASPEKQNQQRDVGYDMRCALMNLTLPIDSLAQQLLQ